MVWDRPTLATLIKRNQADVESELPGVDAKVRRRNLNIIAKMVSLCAHTLYGFIAHCVRQIFPSTSDEENLERHASFWLKGGRKAANYAVGHVLLNGSVDSEVEDGTVLIRSDGVEYEITEGGIFSGTSLSLPAEASVAGKNGNAEPGTTLMLSQPIDGVTSAAIVDADGMTGGADIEDAASVNQRITDRVQNPPHGGAPHDYVTWAKEIPGVTRAWSYPKELGAGKVTVRFVRDDDASIIPDDAEVAVVQNYITRPDKAPLGATVDVVAPIAEPIDFTIQLTPNTPAVRAAVIAQLDDLIKRESKPAETILISHIREAISLAAGERNYVMPTPNADIPHTIGKMATLGVFTWL